MIRLNGKDGLLGNDILYEMPQVKPPLIGPKDTSRALSRSKKYRKASQQALDSRKAAVGKTLLFQDLCPPGLYA